MNPRSEFLQQLSPFSSSLVTDLLEFFIYFPKKMNNTYIIIDFDSTLVQGKRLSSLRLLFWTKETTREKILLEILKITKQGMEGKITFDKSLEKD